MVPETKEQRKAESSGPMAQWSMAWDQRRIRRIHGWQPEGVFKVRSMRREGSHEERWNWDEFDMFR